MGNRNKHIILTYHKVGQQPDAVATNLFKFQIYMIKWFFKCISIPDALNLLSKNELPKRTLSISFDDGYSSFINIALPILLKNRIKPTLFVSSGYLNKEHMWNDIAEINGFKTSAVKYLTLNERNKILKNKKLESADPLITKKQLEEISEMIDIGGHTLDHPILALESKKTAEYQIKFDLDQIKQIINRDVELFAYPNGKYEYDFNESITEIVKKSGYSFAFTTEPYAYDLDFFNEYIIPRFSAPKNGFLNTIKFFLSLYFKNSTPKVIMFESGNGFGGAALAAYEIAETFPRRRGINFITCINSTSGKYSIFNKIESLHLIQFKKIEWSNKKRKISNKFALVYNVFKAIFYLKKEKPTLVYLNNDPYNNLHIVLACKALKIKYIIHHRGIINNSNIVQFVIKNALVNVAISKSVQERIINLNSSVNTRLIYDGYTPIENGDYIWGKPKNLLMIGGFYGWKGQEVVLEAFDEIAKLDSELKLEFVGLNENLTPYEIDFLDQVSKSKYSNRIKVSKFSTSISQLILASDVIIHASLEPEPFGRVVVEGMSAKRIVIASNLGGPSEIIEHEKNGFLFNPFQKEELISIFKKIYSGEYNLNLISKNAFQRSTEFSKYKNSNEICNLILQNLSGHAAK